MVNLDGAFGEESQHNLAALKAILSAAHGQAKVQFGGGLRSVDAIREILVLGVARVILGTAAVENQTLMAEALAAFGLSISCWALMLAMAWCGLLDEKKTSLTPLI